MSDRNTTIEERIKELEERRFMIEMIDHWSKDDEYTYNVLTEEIRKLRQLANY